MIPLACVMRALTILLLLSQFLASASIPQSTHTYSDGTFATVDGVALRDGNNLFVTVGTNAAGQLATSSITSQKLPETVVLKYDLNGNLRSDGQKEFGYDDANQLVEVLVPGKWKSEFLYDALGRRRATKEYSFQSGAWVRTNEVRYVYDRLLLLQERDESNDPKVTYTRGLDLSGTMQGAGGIGGLLARSEASNLQIPHAYYHADGNGNVTTLTGAPGNVVARYLYDPFGRLLAQAGPLAEANHYRFSSKEQHLQGGLYYYGFRFYEPSLQRWINEDPIKEDGGLNLFGFVHNNPVTLVDLLGLAEPRFYQLRMDSKPGDYFYPGRNPGEAFSDFVLRSLLNTLANPSFQNSMAMGGPGSNFGGALNQNLTVKCPPTEGAVKSAPRIVNADSVKAALEGSNMRTTQEAISLPAVERYVRKLEAGSPAPPIKVAGDVIVDGNHTFAAGRVFGTEPAQVPAVVSPSQSSQIRPIQQIKLDSTDWGNE